MGDPACDEAIDLVLIGWDIARHIGVWSPAWRIAKPTCLRYVMLDLAGRIVDALTNPAIGR